MTHVALDGLGSHLDDLEFLVIFMDFMDLHGFY
jgi:hypothetical protein